MDGFGGVLSAQVTCGVLNWTRGLNTLSHRCLTGQTGGDKLATPPSHNHSTFIPSFRVFVL